MNAVEIENITKTFSKVTTPSLHDIFVRIAGPEALEAIEGTEEGEEEEEESDE